MQIEQKYPTRLSDLKYPSKSSFSENPQSKNLPFTSDSLSTSYSKFNSSSFWRSKTKRDSSNKFSYYSAREDFKNSEENFSFLRKPAQINIELESNHESSNSNHGFKPKKYLNIKRSISVMKKDSKDILNLPKPSLLDKPSSQELLRLKNQQRLNLLTAKLKNENKSEIDKKTKYILYKSLFRDSNITPRKLNYSLNGTNKSIEFKDSI
jgi:hypothetical protein